MIQMKIIAYICIGTSQDTNEGNHLVLC
uniref:Uncharacterized protein n=1 Tax=Rhizophora mucronata TaxID=61149 RepID=A0A2P2R4L6_RHIMU